MKTKPKLKIKDCGEKEHTAWAFSGTFEVEGEQYRVTIYWNDQDGYSIDAWKDQHKLVEHLKKFNMTIDEFCREIDEMYEEEMYE